MKLTVSMVAAVLICLLSLAARSSAIRALTLGSQERAYAVQERLALAAIDGHLRGKLQRLSKR